MKRYQTHPQVNNGLRTFTDVAKAVGGVLKPPTGKVTTQEVTDLI